MRRFALSTAAWLLSTGLALAQVGAGASGGGAPANAVGDWGGSPVLSACGTAPAIASQGANNFRGRVVGGTATPTSCLITWGTPRASLPICTITGETTAVLTFSPAPTTLTITFAATNSAAFDYICIGL